MSVIVNSSIAGGLANSAQWNATSTALVRADGGTSEYVPVSIQLDPNSFFGARPISLDFATVTSPYAGSTFAGLSTYIQGLITADSKQAAWEAMTQAQRAYITHPSLVTFQNPFRGYKYWLAHTPYPASDSEFENPCVMASNDCLTWVTPDFFVNPLYPSPAGAAVYNADVHLYWDDTGRQLVLIFVTRNGSTTGTIEVMTLADTGVWSAKTTIYTCDIASIGSMSSPSIWFNSATSLWEIVAVNLDGGGSWPVNKITSSSLLSGWQTTPTALNMPHPVAGRRFWHMSLMRLPSGDIVGVAQDNNGTVGNPGFVYLVRSSDGTKFACSLLSGTVSNRYRPSLAPSITPDADFIVLHSTLTDAGVYVYKFKAGPSDGKELDTTRHAQILTTTLIAPQAALLADSFDRADAVAGANPLATSSGGQTWTNVSGTDTVGITSNAAYNVTTGNCRAIFDVGSTDYTLSAVLGVLVSETNFIVRWVDSNNYVRLLTNTTPPKFQQLIAGAVTDITSGAWTGAAVAAGDLFRIDVTPSRLRGFINGVLYCDVATTQHAAAKTCGMQLSGTSNQRVRSLTVMRRTA